LLGSMYVSAILEYIDQGNIVEVVGNYIISSTISGS
jgi:hypothetical protein